MVAVRMTTLILSERLWNTWVRQLHVVPLSVDSRQYTDARALRIWWWDSLLRHIQSIILLRWHSFPHPLSHIHTLSTPFFCWTVFQVLITQYLKWSNLFIWLFAVSALPLLCNISSRRAWIVPALDVPISSESWIKYLWSEGRYHWHESIQCMNVSFYPDLLRARWILW